MVTCENCGRACERGEDFCGACGFYLNWEEQPAQAAVPQTTTPAASDPPAATQAGSAAPAQPVPPQQPVQPVQPTQPGPPVERPVITGRDDPEPPPAPGELICGQCGVGNVPSRLFCRRCGSSLKDAPVAARPPWWRRILTRRERRVPLAGERPKQRVWRRPRLMVPLLVLALLAGGYAARGWIAPGVELVRDRIATPQQIHAVKLVASSEDPAHPAALAADGTTDRYWAPAHPGDAKGEFLQAEFDGPFRLLDVVISPGISANAEQFLTQGRPQTMLLTLTASDGKVTTRTLKLADSPGAQRFHVAVGDVVRARLTVESSFGAGQDRKVAVAEVEFFKRP